MCLFFNQYAFRWLPGYRRHRHAYWGGHWSRLSSRRCCFFYTKEGEQHPPQPERQQVRSHSGVNWLMIPTKKKGKYIDSWLFYFIWYVTSFVYLFFQCSIKKKWLFKDFWKWRRTKKRPEADWKGSYGNRTSTCFISNTNHISLYL